MVDILEEDIQKALERPNNFGYSGDLPLFDTWGLCGPSKSRDSDCVERANFDSITEEMKEDFPDCVQVVRSSHWAVGWVEQLAVKVLNDNDEPTEAFERIIEIRNCLESYPVYDEQKLTEYELEEATKTVESCWKPNDVDVPTGKILKELYQLYDIYESQILHGRLPDDMDRIVQNIAYDLHFGEREYSGPTLQKSMEMHPEMLEHAESINKLHNIEEMIDNEQKYKPVQEFEVFLGSKRTETLNQIKQYE